MKKRKLSFGWKVGVGQPKTNDLFGEQQRLIRLCEGKDWSGSGLAGRSYHKVRPKYVSKKYLVISADGLGFNCSFLSKIPLLTKKHIIDADWSGLVLLSFIEDTSPDKETHHWCRLIWPCTAHFTEDTSPDKETHHWCRLIWPCTAHFSSKIPLLTVKKHHWCRPVWPCTAHFYRRYLSWQWRNIWCRLMWPCTAHFYRRYLFWQRNTPLMQTDLPCTAHFYRRYLSWQLRNIIDADWSGLALLTRTEDTCTSLDNEETSLMQAVLALYCSLLPKIPLLTMKKHHWCRLIWPCTAHSYRRYMYLSWQWRNIIDAGWSGLYCSLLPNSHLLTIKKHHWSGLIWPLTAQFHLRYPSYNGTETDMSRAQHVLQDCICTQRRLRSVCANVQSNKILYFPHEDALDR